MLIIMIIFALFIIISSDRVFDSFNILLALEIFIYIVSMTKVWFHVIIILILLEFFSIKGFVVLAIKSTNLINPGALFLFSVLIVCEARLGIGLVVSIRRGRGDERVVI